MISLHNGCGDYVLRGIRCKYQPSCKSIAHRLLQTLLRLYNWKNIILTNEIHILGCSSNPYFASFVIIRILVASIVFALNNCTHRANSHVMFFLNEWCEFLNWRPWITFECSSLYTREILTSFPSYQRCMGLYTT